MKRSRYIVGGLALALMFVSGAIRVQSGQASTQQRQMESEARLQKEVRHVLVTQPFYSVFDNLAYSVNGDRVTLEGQVATPTLKSNAEKAVKSIEGVSAVDNQI